MKKTFMFIVATTFLFALDVGSQIPFSSLKDQFGKDLLITSETKKIYISFDKKTGKLLQKRLSKDFLEQNNAIAIYELSKAPSVVISLFMMPGFKKLPFKIAINKDEDLAKILPKQEDKMTIIELNKKIITHISFEKLK